MTLHSAPIEITHALTIHNANPPLSAASDSPMPRKFTPAATPATIEHQPTGLVGCRRVIG